MLIHNSCQSAIQSCIDSKTFAIARLYNDEKTMSIHIHDCYEVYFSISGGKQFLIDNRVYEFGPGDMFFINQFESHHLSQIDQPTHERIVISIYPEFLKRFSTAQTDLNYCFTCRSAPFGHKLSLTEDERKRFLYYVHRLTEKQDFGQDILDQAAFLELMIFLNRIFVSRCSHKPTAAQSSSPKVTKAHRTQIDDILSYINQHLDTNLTIPVLASQFYMSSSHLRNIFKEETGTTVNRYITAKRIAHAKKLLAEGHSVAEVSSLCGYRDYSNFFKSFTRIVGISPKKYALYALASHRTEEA